VDGTLGAITVAPPNPGTDGSVQLALGGGGDTYNVLFSGDRVTNDGAKLFKIVKPPPSQCAPGVAVGGFCWFVGGTGADCNSTCAAQGRVYDEATRTYAGSDGTNANCEAVLRTALGVPGPLPVVDESGNDMGCMTAPFALRRGLDPTTSGASCPVCARYCACM
jgi:hypothetical protein